MNSWTENALHPIAWLPSAVAGYLVSLGIIVLVGWQVGSTFLYSIIPGLPPMVPNTALGLILCGASLWLLSNAHVTRGKRYLGQLLALSSFCIGIFTLGEYLNIAPFGSIDQLLVTLFSIEPLVLRPSPHTSVAFLLGSTALFLLGFQKSKPILIIQSLSLAMLLIAVLVFFGYIYGEIPFYAYSELIGMALHTASAFILLALGILLCNPTTGLMRIISSNTTGGLVIRRLFPAIVLVPLVLGGLITVGRNQGLYSEQFGTALLQTLSVIVMAIIIAHVVTILNREERLKKRAEERARQNQADLAHLHRLNTMNEMASDIAHEINQPLTVISTYAFSCKRMLSKLENIPDDLTHILDTIDSASKLAAGIIRRIREFVQKESADKTMVVVSDLIEDVARLIDDNLHSHSIRLRLLVDENLPLIKVDAIQIEQVLLNLMRNAIEVLQNEDSDNKRITVSIYINKEPKLQIDICDSGPGMAPSVMNNIFESFFTTKGSKGMGMGLSISRSIIELHGGRIWAESALGEGTCVSFTLPLVENTVIETTDNLLPETHGFLP